MKEIGNVFEEKRKEIGITIKEASIDLDIDEILIENLEEGNDKAFKDILKVKEIIKLYAKYLGLEEKKLLEMYNDYLFEKTSKISISDVRERINKEKEKPKEEKKVNSPYTVFVKPKNNSYIILIIILIAILVLFYFLLRMTILG